MGHSLRGFDHCEFSVFFTIIIHCVFVCSLSLFALVHLYFYFLDIHTVRIVIISTDNLL